MGQNVGHGVTGVTSWTARRCAMGQTAALVTDASEVRDLTNSMAGTASRQKASAETGRLEASATAGTTSGGLLPAPKKVLIANRGEIAVRIARAVAGVGSTSVAVFSADDDTSPHIDAADEAIALAGRGAHGYLDVAAVVAAAQAAGCDALHPGYGFLAENPALAQACADADITFVGPTPAQLALFGDKLAARAHAEALGVPLVPSVGGTPTGKLPSVGGTTTDMPPSVGGTAESSTGCSLADAQEFSAAHGSVIIKAVAGGGGRGMRIARPGDDIAAAFERCASEAAASFGNGALYVEALFERARHIEVQIIGDGNAVTHAGERDCSWQRQNQKIIEVAPAPALDPQTREALIAHSLAMAQAVGYRSLGTWEFLVDADDPARIAFLEVNARIQVEHTVTEEVYGLDLAATQLHIAAGATLDDLGLAGRDLTATAPTGRSSIQCRINTETMTADGTARPAGGTLATFGLPSGPGVRVDTYGRVGYATNPAFDSLLAKLIVTTNAGGFAAAVRLARRTLDELDVGGVATNASFLAALLDRAEVATGESTTGFIAAHAAELVAAAAATDAERSSEARADTHAGATANDTRAGAVVDDDPLAVLRYGDIDGAPAERAASDARRAAAAAGSPSATSPSAPSVAAAPAPDGTVAVEAPLQGTIVSLDVAPGDAVAEGTPVAVMEAMKMEHVIAATATGIVRSLGVAVGDTVYERHPLVFVEPADVDVADEGATDAVDPDHIRPDLAEVLARHAMGHDDQRQDAVAKRHGRGHRTARENIADLVDDGTFVEYSPLMVAPQRRRRSLEDLMANTPADGLVGGVASVNGDLFGAERSMAVVMSYDYMVLAGTQGGQSHRKKDRLFEIAQHNQLPVVLLAEGGGGRPGDTDGIGGSGLDCWAFTLFAQLSGLVPLVGVTNGRCFAGNAVLLGCCDVIIATQGSNIGVGGPAMIEGGGLGVFRPEEVGPTDVQVPNGVIDLLVEDEASAMTAAKAYLSYFQGPVDDWAAPDQRVLRHLVPENRLRAYDVRAIINQLADVDSVMELRAGWGPGCVTALARIEGKPIGIVANNNHHLGGAIDADVGDKGSRFIQLCDAHDIPLLFLCDTPGIMVGPQAEYEATVRHAARMFVTAANVSVPFMTIVLRKGYGLGAQAMAGGSFKAPTFTVAWPTGEFGGMGLEGFVKLGYRKEIEAIEDPAERKAYYEERVARLYESGKAVNTATFFEIDDVIDPATSRDWIRMALLAAGPPAPRAGKRRPMVDTW